MKEIYRFNYPGKKRVLRKAGSILFSIIIWLLGIIMLLLFGGRFVGLGTYCISDNSMQPVYQQGTMVYVKNVLPQTIAAGDIITYIVNEDNVTATHRVVAAAEDYQYFYTKGDAAAAVDTDLVYAESIIGTPVFSLPFLGYAVRFIMNQPGMIIAIAGLLLLMLVFCIKDHRTGKRRWQNDPQQFPYSKQY